MGRISIALVFAIVVPPADAAPQKRDSRQSAPATFKLKEVDVEPGALRLGRDVVGTIPKKGLLLALSRQKLILLDLDGDGAIRAGEGDGVALEGFPFVVVLPQPLLCDAGQGALTIDSKSKKEATLETTDLGLDSPLVAAAADLTEVRVRAGLPLLVIDPELCRACEKHCDYLKRNGLEHTWQGGAVHFEDAKRPGFSEDGQRAGWGSSIYVDSPTYREAIWTWHSTVWHAAPMLHPKIERVGVALRHGVAMLYLPGADEAPIAIALHPPDGAVRVPRAFSAGGEVPSPIANVPRLGAGTGFPLIARLPNDWQKARLISFTVKDARGNGVEGHASSPTAPANPKSVPTNAGCAVFLPMRPLAANQTFRARLQVEGKEEITWSFKTGAR